MKLENLQIGDLIFERSYDLMALSIRTVTKAWANHVALYIGNGKVIEANPGGIKINNVNKYVNPRLKKVRFYRILANKNQLLNMIDNAKNMKDYGYDYFQIISMFFLYITRLDTKVKGFQRNKFTICSELIDLAAEQAGINLTTKYNSNVSPQDLMNSNIVYEIK